MNIKQVSHYEITDFLKEFIIYPKMTGAIAPSSHRLSELITDIAELSKADSVIEFGPGTGVFTEKILKKYQKKQISLP